MDGGVETRMALIYPIAEYFESIQGEGPYTGALMLFIRLAGCNVGRYQDPQFESELKLFPRHSVCQSALGAKFLCDTDYHFAERLDLEPLIRRTNARHVCLTGGEPFLHDLLPIVKRVVDLGKVPHIETSGTLPIPDGVFRHAFIVCSPKVGFLPENRGKIHHYKFVLSREDLADEPSQVWQRLLSVMGEDEALWTTVSLQPVNGLHSLDKDLAIRIMNVLHAAPDWVDPSLSFQIHKVLGLR